MSLWALPPCVYSTLLLMMGGRVIKLILIITHREVRYYTYNTIIIREFIKYFTTTQTYRQQVSVKILFKMNNNQIRLYIYDIPIPFLDIPFQPRYEKAYVAKIYDHKAKRLECIRVGEKDLYPVY